MFNKILHILPGNHHRFRHMTFDELSELYTSLMLRSLAIGMAGIFIPIYLYQNGFEIWQIFLFFGISFFAQTISAIPIGKLIGRFGPKHIILASFFLQSISMLGLVKISHLFSIWPLAVVFGIANIMFFMSFHVDFSKVKHRKSDGKELGVSFLMEKSGAVLGPLVGGLIAYLFAPQYTFVFAIGVALLGALPLFLTSEPIKVHQKVEFKAIKLPKVKRDILSYGFMTISIATSMIVWPLFIGIIVFAENPYVQIGSIASVSILFSLVAGRLFGKMVDNKKGRLLLRFNSALGALTGFFRPFVSSYPMALAVNLANDIVLPGYRIPYMKGMYDRADDYPGNRVAYITTLEFFATFFRAVYFFILALFAYFVLVDRLFFGFVFVFAGLCTLLITIERYPALKSRKRLL